MTLIAMRKAYIMNHYKLLGVLDNRSVVLGQLEKFLFGLAA